MPAIDVFWLNHSMTFLPNRPPQLTASHLIDDLEICSTQYQARAFVWLPVRCRQRAAASASLMSLVHVVDLQLARFVQRKSYSCMSQMRPYPDVGDCNRPDHRVSAWLCRSRSAERRRRHLGLSCRVKKLKV